jgi:glycosyltransferase involved in cell wall biosynthesis
VRVAITLEQCWHAVPGGTAVAAIELARTLVERTDPEVVGVSARHRRPPAPEWRPPIEPAQLRLPRPLLYEAWHYLRRPDVQSATGPVDVIHATGIAMPPRTRPLVLTIHDLSYLVYPELFSRHGLRFFRRALSLALEEATIVLCSSLATVEHCREVGFAEERLRHVPLGVRARQATADDVERVRAAYGLGGRYVLWTGTVEPRKNLSGLLRAFAGLDADVALALVGPTGWSEDLERLVAALPEGARERVRRLGWVPGEDLTALYGGAAVFCFPSLLEGFGFPVVEAMAQGTPVVTSLGTSTEELVAGGAGIAVDPRDPERIAEALATVLDDDAVAQRLATAGRARAAEYTWERTADSTVAAYADAIRLA